MATEPIPGADPLKALTELVQQLDELLPTGPATRANLKSALEPKVRHLVEVLEAHGYRKPV